MTFGSVTINSDGQRGIVATDQHTLHELLGPLQPNGSLLPLGELTDLWANGDVAFASSMLNAKNPMMRCPAGENTTVRFPWGWLTIGRCFGNIDVGGACYVDMGPKRPRSSKQLTMFVIFENISQAKTNSTTALLPPNEIMPFPKKAEFAMKIELDRIVVFQWMQILSKLPSDLQQVKEEKRQRII